MTFNAAVPLNSDSPSIFPAQNQTNMARLQTLIGADHQFNLSAAANDGYHNLIHLTQQAPSGALAATGRLYVKSTGGIIQLFYMDDTGVEHQVTPFDLLNPFKVNGSQVLGGMASTNIFNVAYDFTGIGVAFISSTSVQRTYNFTRSGAATNIIEINNNAGPSTGATIQFSGTILTVQNQSAGSQSVVWSLMINRL